MREIKFRAWDKMRKQFFTSPKWVEFTIDVNGLLSAKNIIPPVGNGQGYQELEIMQYTGLKDKNGVEIYEGDILQNHSNGDKSTVIFKGGAFLTNSEYGISFISPVEDFEVIGNIYENKDLL